jgi:D-3-phosphoglycerate dehydrogenase / 2-oxoglutarate reductase
MSELADPAPQAPPPATGRARVLVKERIAQAGLDLLAQQFQVDVELEMPADKLSERIGEYDALIVRSATSVDADLLARAERLKVVGRAGTGVDNVDVAEATRRGIIVANAPGSNMVSAAEHAIGLLLALARNIPQAHAALVQGRWERSRFGGVELQGKTLGVLGFGRIGQLVAARARGLGMQVVAHDPFVTPERFREAQVAHCTLDEVLAGADFITLHAPLTADTRHLIRSETIDRMKPGVRIVNAARGDLVDLEALVAALKDGRVAAAALDVFPSEPYTDGEVLTLPNVVVTPHLGASTQEAQDRAGVIVAEQVAAALAGGFVSNAVNIPFGRAEDIEVMGPFLPLASKLGRLAAGLSGGGFDRVEVTCSGALAEYDTRLLSSAVLVGAFAGHVDEHVNLVNARTIAEGMGIHVVESAEPATGHFTNLITVSTLPGEAVSGTTIGRDNRPWLVAVHPYQVEIELDAHMMVMLNDDRPGMIGRVGTLLGEHAVNIANMNVSRNVPGEAAVMVLSVDTPPAPEVLDTLRAEQGIQSVRVVSLTGI